MTPNEIHELTWRIGGFLIAMVMLWICAYSFWDDYKSRKRNKEIFKSWNEEENKDA